MGSGELSLEQVLSLGRADLPTLCSKSDSNWIRKLSGRSIISKMNPGIALDEGWLASVRINLPAVNRRAATLGTNLTEQGKYDTISPKTHSTPRNAPHRKTAMAGGVATEGRHLPGRHHLGWR